MTTDRQLVARSQRGERAAFTELYNRHSPSVLRYAFALSHDAADAQDLLQETFITAWHRLGKASLRTSSALPWLLVTCRNHAQNLRRSKEIRVTVPLDEVREHGASEGTLDRLAREEELHWIFKTIQLADTTDRQIVEACIIGGMPYREAAQQTGLSEQAVAKRIHRLRSRLTEQRVAREGEGS